MRTLLLVLLVLALAALACDIGPPDYTPSPPQLTAGALNSTYEAQASAAPSATPSPAASPSPTPTPSPTLTLTLTSSICELSSPGPATFVLEVPPCP